MTSLMWMGVVVLCFALLLIFIIGSSIKNAAVRKAKRERYLKMTGRAEGKVLERRMVKTNVHNTREPVYCFFSESSAA